MSKFVMDDEFGREMCHECGEQEVADNVTNLCSDCDCFEFQGVSSLYLVVDDPGVRCDCEDFPCCRHGQN